MVYELPRTNLAEQGLFDINAHFWKGNYDVLYSTPGHIAFPPGSRAIVYP